MESLLPMAYKYTSDLSSAGVCRGLRWETHDARISQLGWLVDNLSHTQLLSLPFITRLHHQQLQQESCAIAKMTARCALYK